MSFTYCTFLFEGMGGRHYERTHKQCLMRPLPPQARADYIQQWRSYHPCVGHLQEVTRHTSVAHTHIQLFIFYFLFPVFICLPCNMPVPGDLDFIIYYEQPRQVTYWSYSFQSPFPLRYPHPDILMHSISIHTPCQPHHPLHTTQHRLPTPSALPYPTNLFCPNPPHPTQARSPDIQERVGSILDSSSAQRAESTRSRCVCVCVWVQ